MSWLLWYCVLSHCLFTFFLYKSTEDINGLLTSPKRKESSGCQQKAPFESNERQNLNIILQGSSVWCYGYDRRDRICKFRNLCYSSSVGDYLFFHGPSSIVSGVPDKRCSPALLDLSSIDDHNIQYFNYQDAPVAALKHFSEIMVEKHPSLIFHRFNPDNLMHVIHDDLLPLFYTLREYFPDFTGRNSMKPFNSGVQLVFMEGRQEGPLFDLYEIFSERRPMLRMSSLKNNSLVCFQDAVVGISKATTWYDYGFKVPQGAKKNHTVKGEVVHQFTQYVTEKLGITKSESTDRNYVVLFSREVNRRILNEFDLAFAIATTFNLKVIRLSLETNTLHDIIKSVRNSAGIIGMHGSILSLAVFLLPGSFLVELFPYAVDPDSYTPYKTLSRIPSMDISYGSWENKIKENTVVHPNRTKAEGGIMHLSMKEQKYILNADTIPKHLCCDNPHWLFRIYQDTIVDIKSFVEVMQKCLDSRQTSNSSRNIWQGYPGKIEGVHCKGLETSTGPAIFVAWQPSWNTQFFNSQEVGYEVWIQSQTDKEYMAYALDSVTEHTFTENVKQDTSYSIWIRGVLSSNTGPFSVACTCMTH